MGEKVRFYRWFKNCSFKSIIKGCATRRSFTHPKRDIKTNKHALYEAHCCCCLKMITHFFRNVLLLHFSRLFTLSFFSLARAFFFHQKKGNHHDFFPHDYLNFHNVSSIQIAIEFFYSSLDTGVHCFQIKISHINNIFLDFLMKKKTSKMCHPKATKNTSFLAGLQQTNEDQLFSWNFFQVSQLFSSTCGRRESFWELFHDVIVLREKSENQTVSVFVVCHVSSEVIRLFFNFFLRTFEKLFESWWEGFKVTKFLIDFQVMVNIKNENEASRFEALSLFLSFILSSLPLNFLSKLF